MISNQNIPKLHMNGILQKTEAYCPQCSCLVLTKKYGGSVLKAMNGKQRYLIEETEEDAPIAVGKRC